MLASDDLVLPAAWEQYESFNMWMREQLCERKLFQGPCK